MQSKAEKAHCLMGIEGVTKELEYDQDKAMIIAFIMADINHKAMSQGYSFYQQYALKKGLTKFWEEGVKAAKKEIRQLLQRVCFAPVDVSKLTLSGLKEAVEALMFLSQKKNKVVKGRCV